MSGLSCDSPTSGQPVESTGPLRLVKIMIQDEGPLGGRNLATDLLEKSMHTKCSAQSPCVVGNQNNLPCPLASGQSDGVCPDPLDPAETPPAIGTVLDPNLYGTVYGGISIRLVFNKILDASIETALPDNKTPGQINYALAQGAVELDGPDGPVATVSFYDPSGSPDTTTDLFAEPFGPAIVLKPLKPLAPASKYTLKILDATKIKDRTLPQPNVLSLDSHGPIKASYDFTVEALYPLSFSPAATTRDGTLMPVLGNDVLVLTTNAQVAPSTLQVTVRNAAGVVVLTEAFVDVGTDPKNCAANQNNQQIDIVPVSAPGMPIDWHAGDYTVDVLVKDATSKKASLATDAFGKTLFTNIKFTVDSGPRGDPASDYDAVDNFVLPESCVALANPDMGMP